MIFGVITARGGSKGLPGKNIALLRGIPLVGHIVRAARESLLLSDFVVSTDDPKIAETSRAFGATVPSLRPAELATDEASPWRAVLHSVVERERSTGQQVDVAVLLQPTSPLCTGADIDACITRFQDVEANICATVMVAPHSPYFDMVEPCHESSVFMRPVSPHMLNQVRRQEAHRVYSINGAVFVVRRSLLPDLYNHFALKRFAVLEMPAIRSVEIDSEEDLSLAECLLSGKADVQT